MKFYLTKSAQLAAEGRPKPEKPRVMKATKVKATVVVGTDPAVVTTVEAPAPEAKSSSLVPTKRSHAVPRNTVVKQPRGVIAIGGQPRVDLLPLEVRSERKAGQNTRRAWFGVAAVVIVVAIAAGAATVYAQNATSSLTSAQGETATLSQQAAKYSGVKTVQGLVDLVVAARAVGGGTDIDWSKYLADIALTVPSDATLKDVTVDSASPVVAYAQAAAPLQGQRVATVTISATSSSLPSVPAWLDRIAKLPAYEDATAGLVNLKDGVYTTTVTLHVNKKAFSNAFAKGN